MLELTTRTSAPQWLRAAASLAGVAACGVVGCSSNASDEVEKTAATTAEALDYPDPCGDTCHGACGANCSACNVSFRYVCEVDNNRNNTGYKRKINHYTCGTHAGCREHDDCLDACAAQAACSWSESSCTIACHAKIVAEYGISNATSWAGGGGPYDGTSTFEYEDPNGKTYDTQACPLPASGGGSPPPPPPNCDWASCMTWNGSACVCACQYPAWCNGMGGCMGP